MAGTQALASPAASRVGFSGKAKWKQRWGLMPGTPFLHAGIPCTSVTCCTTTSFPFPIFLHSFASLLLRLENLNWPRFELVSSFFLLRFFLWHPTPTPVIFPFGFYMFQYLSNFLPICGDIDYLGVHTPWLAFSGPVSTLMYELNFAVFTYFIILGDN